MRNIYDVLRWIALPFAVVAGSVFVANLLTWPIRLIFNDFITDLIVSVAIGSLAVHIASAVAPAHSNRVATITFWLMALVCILAVVAVFVVNYNVRESFAVILYALATLFAGYVSVKQVVHEH